MDSKKLRNAVNLISEQILELQPLCLKIYRIYNEMLSMYIGGYTYTLSNRVTVLNYNA